MNASPYRQTGQEPRAPKRRALFEDLSVLAVFGVFWVISVLRAVGAFARHEVFGTESTLALMAAIGVPLLLINRRARPSQRGEGSWPAA